MLKRLKLENFKGFKNADVEFGRVTVFIGPNGTGKSSISQALTLLRQSRGSSQLTISGPLINLGTFDDVLTKGVLKREIGISISVSVGTNVHFGITSGASYSYSASFDPNLISFDASINKGKNEFLVGMLRMGRRDVLPEEVISYAGEEKLVLKLGPGTEVANPIVVIGHSWPKDLNSIGQKFDRQTRAYLSAISELLGKTYCVPAIRGLDQPEYALGAESKIDFAAGNNAEVATAFVYAGRDIERTISRWTKSITGSDIDGSVIPNRRVTIRSYAAAGGIPVIGDGFGTNQLVQFLLTLAIIPNQSVLSIEEPEIHLHPKAQKNLCDILLEVAKEQDKQIILSTHSQYILFGFVEAVRNKKLKKDELAIYYFEDKGKEPSRVVQDEYGDIYDWGVNFFR